ncbi:MAG TPA: 50S ribosomal protein L11 methyltransferase [Chitinophagaceae bacterium]|jgi:ribosomal protein L11 methyltransferase|nr:50S ribosomal protein L11 methyltransferase [Chitinophagaceae bacterium]
MTDFLKVEFEFLSKEQKEIIIAFLTEMNYEGFEEEGDLLKAYVSSNLYDQNELKTLAAKHNLSFSITEIENKNWNQLWESKFDPVIIDDASHKAPWVAIRADFHKPIKNVEHEIIITPKMSFGTGHHATTFMMIKMMSEINFTGKVVLDFGTGTGILAILSEKLGASKIVAIDNDDQSIRNASENFSSNNCTKIQLLEASSAEGDNQFDVILANIIKTVIKNNLQAFVKQLTPGGVILLSGLLEDDEQEILEVSMKNNLILKKKIKARNWICLQMINEQNINRLVN